MCAVVKRPPTLAKRSGVSQRQLTQIASWLQQLDAVAHQQAASLANAVNGAAGAADGISVPPAREGGSMASILGHQGQAPGNQSSRAVQQDGDRLAATGAVSATAAAVYRDRRFRISFPCAITVGASVVLKGSPNEGSSVAGAEAAGRELTACATQHAKQIAEDVARRTVDLIGRRNLEETVCESLIKNIKAHRAKAKAEVQAQKEKQSRQMQAQQAQHLIQRAVEHAVAHGGTPPQSCRLKMAMTTVGAAAAVGNATPAAAMLRGNSDVADMVTDGPPALTSLAAAAAAAAVTHSPASTVPRLNLLASGNGSGGGGSSESDAGSVESPTTPRRLLSDPSNENSAASVPEAPAQERPPTPPPATSPTSRVTIDDLKTLLNAGGSAAGQSTPAPSGKVSIADLPSLLQSQQPTSRDH